MISKVLLITMIFTSTNVNASDCTPTTRMPYEQSHRMKLEMLHAQGLSSSSIWAYELDHIVPLCMGGTNDFTNLQLQLWPDAKRKDIDEVALCEMILQRVITCDEAQETMRHWHD
jgi:hypothetical protein